MISARRFLAAFIAAVALVIPRPSAAELVLSELIVDLQPGKHARDDVEIWNKSDERSYVALEPREIVDPSLPTQKDRREPDPEKLGLLVSPGRMILEPGQRKLLRIATLAPASDREHIYRVMVKPVIGSVDSASSGLKILVGYDLLVLVRPTNPVPNVTAVRIGRSLTFSNRGNVSVEVIDGTQCKEGHSNCTQLPGKRLYPGALWTVELGSDLPAEFTLKSPGKSDRKIF